jgi:hypothetical protein
MILVGVIREMTGLLPHVMPAAWHGRPAMINPAYDLLG